MDRQTDEVRFKEGQHKVKKQTISRTILKKNIILKRCCSGTGTAGL